MHKKNDIICALVAAFSLMVVATFSNAEPMKFFTASNGGSCNGCTWTAAVGEFVEDTPEVLQAFLEENPDRLTIYFDSPGGSLASALEVGKILRKERISVDVGKTIEIGPWEKEISEGGQCLSSCVYAFLGGVERNVSLGRLGVHQFGKPDNGILHGIEAQTLMGRLLFYMFYIKADPRILSLASTAKPNEMIYLSELELETYGVVSSNGFSAFDLLVEEGGLLAVWKRKAADQTIADEVRLRCSRQHKAWVLTVRDFDSVNDTLPYLEEDPNPLWISIDANELVVDHTMIISSIATMQELSFSVRLPIDIRNHPSKALNFAPNTIHHRFADLSGEVQLPDQQHLDAMVRTCGV